MNNLIGLTADVCGLMRRAGCTIRCAHCHGGIAVAQVDRRPAIDGFSPTEIDGQGHIVIGGVHVFWGRPQPINGARKMEHRRT